METGWWTGGLLESPVEDLEYLGEVWKSNGKMDMKTKNNNVRL